MKNGAKVTHFLKRPRDSIDLIAFPSISPKNFEYWNETQVEQNTENGIRLIIS